MHDHSHDDLFGDALERLVDLLTDSTQAIYVFLDDDLKACNDRFAKLLGYKSPEEWGAREGSFPDLFVDPGSQERLITTYQAAMEHGKGAQVPITWRRKDGKPAKSNVILVPFDHEGHRMALHFVDPA